MLLFVEAAARRGHHKSEAGGWRGLAIFLGIYLRPHRNAKRIVAERFGLYKYRTEI